MSRPGGSIRKGNSMITVNNVSMNFSGQTLFKNVDLKFVPGNCYGIIGRAHV